MSLPSVSLSLSSAAYICIGSRKTGPEGRGGESDADGKGIELMRLLLVIVGWSLKEMEDPGRERHRSQKLELPSPMISGIVSQESIVGGAEARSLSADSPHRLEGS